jgi:hypothetical protein
MRLYLSLDPACVLRVMVLSASLLLPAVVRAQPGQGLTPQIDGSAKLVPVPHLPPRDSLPGKVIPPDLVPGNNETNNETPPKPVAQLTDIAIPGSVEVTIQPPEALADGAVWTLDDNPAPLSGPGQRLVSPGRHTVRFQNLAKWLEPLPVEVFVIGGQTAQVAVAFAPIPSFDIRAVPEQHARQGESLEFFLNEPFNVPVEASATPPPAGSITFDPASGHFTYTPATSDRLPFSLTFSTGGVAVATSVITPLPKLPAEEFTIDYDRPLPDAESRDYITISEVRHAAEVFNDATNETLTVSISGKTLVFEANHPAHLHRQYNGRDNIKEFRLYADRVIIRSPLLLPQTHVSIHARELRFEGDGVINTTPRARRLQPPGVVWEDDRTVGYPGDPGHDGGDADVFVERFHADPTPAVRFVLRGGEGGPGGEGRDGLSEGNGMFGLSLQDPNWTKLMARAGNHICGIGNNRPMLYQQNVHQGVPDEPCGSQVEAKGEPAVPSGVPGNGGRGGTLRSTLDLSAFAEQTGGAPGAPGGNHVGGNLFFTYIYRVTSFRTVRGQLTVTHSDTIAPRVPGADAPAPRGANGTTGSVVSTNPPAWLHSFGVRAVVQFAKDAYLDGHVTEARALLSDYLGYIEALQPAVASVTNLSNAEFAETTGLDQLALEIGTLLHRIDSNLDFFGNPAGWVPMLSFEANLIAFQQEIEQSIPILYLAYWLNNAATNLQSSLAASTMAVGKLKAEQDEMAAAYNQAQLAIPRLKVESSVIATRIAGLQSNLLLLEQELLARAQQNVEERNKVPFWKKALSTLSVVADLVPIGQPAVGKIGAGLGLLARIDPDHPVQSASKITNVLEVFSKNVDIRVCFSNSTTNSTNNVGNTNNAAARKQQLKQLTECGKFLKSELKQLAAVFKEVQVDNKEVQAELEKIKASDAAFQQVTAELVQLNLDKERFAQQLAAAVQAVTTLTSAMAENSLATDSLESRIAEGLATLDHNALLHIREMERRAKDRLLMFQYFVAKAFQYRALQPYRGNLHLNRLFARFQELVANNSHLLSPTDFNNLKTVYLAELRDTVAQALAIRNANAPQQSISIPLPIVGEDLRKLNTEGRLTINPSTSGIFPGSHENLRIINLRTRTLTAHTVGGNLGALALLFLDFEHLGISRLHASGQNFLFRHYQTEAVKPITWHTVLEGTNVLKNSQISASEQSILSVLLDQPTPNNILLFSQPAADADILIRKEVQTDNGIDIAIDSLVIEVEYEFAAANSGRPLLEVVVTDDLQPIIALDQADINGRRDGQGDFQRIFPSGAMVTLQAPASYGGRAFDRWVINDQPRSAGATSVSVAMTTPTTARARFAPLPSSGAPPEIVQEPQHASAALGSTATFTVGAVGSEPLTFRWLKNGEPLADGGPFSGATSATLVLSNVGLTEAGGYSVTVSNPSGTRTSQTALLVVTAPSLSPVPAQLGSVGFQFSTVPGVRFVVERKLRLDDPEWTAVETMAGTGAVLQFTPPIAAGSAFFRLRAESSP